MLSDLEDNRNAYIKWADAASKILQNGDILRNRHSWNPRLEARSRILRGSRKQVRKLDRIKWTIAEFCFFHATCQDRSLVTGRLLIKAKEGQNDRIFNTNFYQIGDTTFIEGGLSVVKGFMPEFADSTMYPVSCKTVNGVIIMRAYLWYFLVNTRPFQAQ
ncbi:hypothetical protein BGZ93_008032 [Podila epicladia]|nr:hypothetical protein BGZ93_008032 [Podila epicladia]